MSNMSKEEKLKEIDTLPDDLQNGDMVYVVNNDETSKEHGHLKDYYKDCFIVEDLHTDSHNDLKMTLRHQKDDHIYRYDSDRKNDRTYIRLTREKPAMFENIDVDLEPLDKLILDQDKKDQIVETLKQAEEQNKIFDEWGLGETIEYGHGMTMLFHGIPGTGKTWGAQCIAECFGKEMMSLSIAEIQTQEPGGAARNIQQAFRTADSEDKLLFFDECDSLISSRQDVGMILGGEINTLLTELEKFEGVAIFSTNRVERLDKALERRISLILEFPTPNKEARRKIWDTLIPEQMPLGEDVNFDKIAEIEMVGGLIKNTVLKAARKAAAQECDEVKHNHFVDAAEEVYESQGRMGKSRHMKANMVRTGAGVSKQADMSMETGMDVTSDNTASTNE